MHDFLSFMRHFFKILHFVRGVIQMLLLMLLICVVVICVAEDISFGEGVYFVLITAMTIGYGDVTPATTLGKIMSLATGAIGFLACGIIVAVATRALREAYEEKSKGHHKKD